MFVKSKVIKFAAMSAIFVLLSALIFGCADLTFEGQVGQTFQEQMLDVDSTFSRYGVVVENVFLVQTEHFSYDGTITLSVDENKYDVPKGTTFDTPIRVQGNRKSFRFFWEQHDIAEIYSFLRGLQLKPVAPEIEMVSVRGGTFTMGCTPEQEESCTHRERPAHSVTVSDFSIGKYEVTQRQWEQVMRNNPSGLKGDNLPVTHVSWDDVQEFIRRLNLLSGKKYRLPTEAEWEYAARGGNRSSGFKYAGSNNISDVAWYYENSGDVLLNDSDWDNEEIGNSNARRNNNRAHPVGNKRGNELGIHDMSCNVWELVSNWLGAYNNSAETNPIGPSSGSVRVIRGGGWNSTAFGCRVSFRRGLAPDRKHNDLGFRLVLE